MRCFAAGHRNCCANRIVHALGVVLFFACSTASVLAQERKAVWVTAQDSIRGPNVVRDDGRVVAYRNGVAAKGPRLIPGLENIVATTTQLALRRDGVVSQFEFFLGLRALNLRKEKRDVGH